jgi:hypothetical protein
VFQRRDKELDRTFRDSIKEASGGPLEPEVLKVLSTLFRRRVSPSSTLGTTTTKPLLGATK